MRGFLFIMKMKKIPKINLTQKPQYKKIAEDVDFFVLFQKIVQSFPTCFLFESLGEEGKFSRYSLIGFDPKHIISARENILFVDGEGYTVPNPYETLQQMMPKQIHAKLYAGGLVGYLGYDAVNYFEPSIRVKTHSQFDQFLFGIYTDGVIFDKVTNELLYFYYDTDRSIVVQSLFSKKVKKREVKVTFIKESLTKKEHAEIVANVKKQIESGNTFQCEVGFKSNYSIEGDALQIYEQLRAVNPSPFMYYVQFGEKKIIGASPELLFSVRDGEMTTRPLAGTIRRGKTEKEDSMLARTLLHDTKEIAEHTMLVDMHRNDLGKVSKFGTVKVREAMSIKRFSHVQHISSEVVGQMESGSTMFSGLASNFPMGTVCGTPKVETMKIIDANEPLGRGPYGGGVGHFGFNGDCTFALALRSLFVSGTDAYTQTSGGIVADSVAENEYNEIQNKLAAMRRVLSL
jgi:anthranilate synthase component 1